MFGIINEIAGENGLGWQRRHILINGTVSNPNTDERTRNFWHASAASTASREARLLPRRHETASILKFLSERIDRQKAKGSKFFIGDRLTRPRHLLGDVFRDHAAAAA